MIKPWLKRIRVTGELKVYCPANPWSAEVTKAITTFNGLSLGCQLKVASDDRSADVVVKLCKGKRDKHNQLVKGQIFTIPHPNGTINSPGAFVSDKLGGYTRMLIDDIKREVFLAGIFLPGDYPKPTADQKEMIIVHELIHSTGMDEHDSYGLMFDSFQPQGTGLLEMLPDKDSKPMPPVRLGGKTRCKVALAWKTDAKEVDINGAEVCKTN
jgi:hypothetical protein